MCKTECLTCEGTGIENCPYCETEITCATCNGTGKREDE